MSSLAGHRSRSSSTSTVQTFVNSAKSLLGFDIGKSKPVLHIDPSYYPPQTHSIILDDDNSVISPIHSRVDSGFSDTSCKSRTSVRSKLKRMLSFQSNSSLLSPPPTSLNPERENNIDRRPSINSRLSNTGSIDDSRDRGLLSNPEYSRYSRKDRWRGNTVERSQSPNLLTVRNLTRNDEVIAGTNDWTEEDENADTDVGEESNEDDDEGGSQSKSIFSRKSLNDLRTAFSNSVKSNLSSIKSKVRSSKLTGRPMLKLKKERSCMSEENLPSCLTIHKPPERFNISDDDSIHSAQDDDIEIQDRPSLKRIYSNSSIKSSGSHRSSSIFSGGSGRRSSIYNSIMDIMKKPKTIISNIRFTETPEIEQVFRPYRPIRTASKESLARHISEFSKNTEKAFTFDLEGAEERSNNAKESVKSDQDDEFDEIVPNHETENSDKIEKEQTRPYRYLEIEANPDISSPYLSPLTSVISDSPFSPSFVNTAMRNRSNPDTNPSTELNDSTRNSYVAYKPPPVLSSRFISLIGELVEHQVNRKKGLERHAEEMIRKNQIDYGNESSEEVELPDIRDYYSKRGLVI